MSVRLRIFANSITALLVLNIVNIVTGFVLFWFIATPYIGQRLSENAGNIAARYFSLAGIAVLFLTAIGSIWVIGVSFKRVTGPLERLKHAVSEIREGNLDYELIVDGNDEFTELGAGFEQMRIRLKNTMKMQESAQSEHRSMMATITHDLQTPITSIMGYAEGILDGVADTKEKVNEYADVIRRKAQSLKTLAEDLSLLSRLDNAQLPLDKREVDLSALINKLVSEFYHNIPNVELDVQILSDIHAHIDEEKIARVMVNILENSVKYANPENTVLRIRITFDRHEQSALLAISDNGIGISQEDLPHVFDQFYRADASRNRQTGSGLGLSIARRLINLHDGSIWIMNNQESGITVSISLPIFRSTNYERGV